MTLWHPVPRIAERAIARMTAEIDRLENIFSLYRPRSVIARLNRDGALDRPSADFRRVLDHGRRMSEASGGAFDPTIQPLWRLYAAGAALPTAEGAARLDRARALVDHAAITAGRRAVRFDRPGMALSLNAIAQGYITDRIAELLGNEGFESAVIELGKTRALGAMPDGSPFRIGMIAPEAPATIADEVTLANAAPSVSGGYGTTFDGPAWHHIFDPATGHSANRLRQVAVLSSRAITADALSTAIYVAGEAAAPRLLDAHPGARAILTRNDGSTRTL